MISVRSVHKAFGNVHAVRGVSFDLRPGQVTALLGPNGAGKTTTIRMITGFTPPDAGEIRIGEADTLDQSVSARRQIGYLPEATPLYGDMRVGDYLSYRAKLFGMGWRDRVASIEEVMRRCWLTDVRKRRIGTLSKGYKQRVGLAAAMVHHPSCLILDEPTNGLDPSQIRETRELIRDVSRQRTMLVSTHILGEVERLCDRVIIIAGGRVCADGTPAELVARARQAITYVVQCRRAKADDDAKALSLWRNIPHIEDIQPNEHERAGLTQGWSLWVLTAKPGAPDLREQIGIACAQAGLTLKELRKEVPSLERVFLRLIGADESPNERAAAAMMLSQRGHAAGAFTEGAA